MSRAALLPSRFAPLLTSLAAIAAALLLGGAFLAAARQEPNRRVRHARQPRAVHVVRHHRDPHPHGAPAHRQCGAPHLLRAGVWNIGIDGQLLVGALFAGVAAAAIAGQVANPIMWLVAALAGLAGGLLWALVPGILRVHWGLNEIITTDDELCRAQRHLLAGQGPGGRTPSGVPPANDADPEGDAAARHPPHGSPYRLAHRAPRRRPGAILFRHTVLGFMLDVLGKNRQAANHAGMPVNRLTLFALLASGTLAGLAGRTTSSA